MMHVWACASWDCWTLQHRQLHLTHTKWAFDERAHKN